MKFKNPFFKPTDDDKLKQISKMLRSIANENGITPESNATLAKVKNVNGKLGIGFMVDNKHVGDIIQVSDEKLVDKFFAKLEKVK